ncbi:transcription factor ZMS1 [Fusarium beomiforme]|uniref:Transcription factor ZMS1 n=1 Tax=Fusarium beomiforme TaxID=44412 RepID=A0A9P5AAT7_9HYPO|nr:transcription factor ZMS1 [Fusarium beomiforme]
MASIQQQTPRPGPQGELLLSSDVVAPPSQSTDREDTLETIVNCSPATTQQLTISRLPNLEKDTSLQVDHHNRCLSLAFDGPLPANSQSDHLASINWLPFDSLSMGSLDLQCPPETAHMAYEVDNVTMHAYLGPDTGSSLPSTTETPGQAMQQHHVSALITSMATSGLNKTHGPECSDGSLPSMRALNYSDGAGFRESQSERYMRQRRASHIPAREQHSDLQTQPAWVSELSARASAISGSSEDISDIIFEELISRIEEHKHSTQLLSSVTPHKSLLFSKPVLKLFINLYFDRFHPVNPFIDRSHLRIPLWGWSLCLATAAIGAKYLGLEEVHQFGDSLCSILHEIMDKELDFIESQEPLPYIQSRILAAIGLCQSRQSGLWKCGYNAMSMVANACCQLDLLTEDDKIGSYDEEQDLEQLWVTWRFRETRRRTGLFFWLTSCWFALASGHCPSLYPDTPKLKLPCHDELWDAESPRLWFKVAGVEYGVKTAFTTEESSRPAAHEVTLELWQNMTFQCSSNCFATIIIVHKLVHRRWGVGQYLKDPLRYEHDQVSSRIATPQYKYFGSIPEYNMWRNQCCDCLDVLHWEALSLSVRAGGLEDSRFLHLHLARLSLLTPLGDLLAFAQDNSKSSHSTPNNIFRSATSNPNPKLAVRVWATQDRYKARLAVVHAGAILWHVRRYSCDAIVEPLSLFLAALVLWAYGQTSSIRKSHESAQELPESGNDKPMTQPRMPSAMQLDRPVDDEIVQYFIRSGEKLKLALEGIDDLCSANGPMQILIEVTNLLTEEQKPWSVSWTYAQFLSNLKAPKW